MRLEKNLGAGWWLMGAALPPPYTFITLEGVFGEIPGSEGSSNGSCGGPGLDLVDGDIAPGAPLPRPHAVRDPPASHRRAAR